MRKLILKREKKFVSCLSPFYLFLSCPEFEATLKIDDIFFKAIGQIENNNTAVFEIATDSLILLASYSSERPNKNIHTYFNIPPGTDDISLNIKANFDIFGSGPITISNL